MSVKSTLPDPSFFPEPDKADPDGLLAIGGDLSVNTLIDAYSHGIFPWYSEGSPILWWSPDPRLILFPEKLKTSKSLRQIIEQKRFSIKIDTCFSRIIENCASVKRKNQEGTWITDEMKEAYINLHNEGYAHSVETFYNNVLVGGLYGVSIGKAFFGESMFYKMTDASKVALYYLVKKLKKLKFHFIDAQQSTEHMKSIGAEEISRQMFLKLLRGAVKVPARKGKWQ